jgi:hypothetical protein
VDVVDRRCAHPTEVAVDLADELFDRVLSLRYAVTRSRLGLATWTSTDSGTVSRPSTSNRKARRRCSIPW